MVGDHRHCLGPIPTSFSQGRCEGEKKKMLWDDGLLPEIHVTLHASGFAFSTFLSLILTKKQTAFAP